MNFKALICVVACLISHTVEAQTRVMHHRVERLIDMAEQQDTIVHHLSVENPDSLWSLFDMLFFAANKQSINAWTTDSFTKIMTKYELMEMRARGKDTMEIVDPISGKLETKIVSDAYMDWFYKYRILEDWTFDPLTGKTNVSITGIGPVKEEFNSNGSVRSNKTMFWMRYEDVKSIIAEYEQYHPNNTIAGRVWNDYFFSDIKPQVLK